MTPHTSSAGEVLDREFLLLRAKLLEAAATLDRLARAEGNADGDPRMLQVRKALSLLHDGGPRDDLTEQMQLIFSSPYDESWREKFLPE